MVRKKVRHHESRDALQKRFREWERDNQALINDKLPKMHGCVDMDDLHNFEYSMGFGFDCGWLNVMPRNSEQAREWRLDEGYGGPYYLSPAMKTQSSTLQMDIWNLFVEATGEDGYDCYIYLD